MITVIPIHYTKRDGVIRFQVPCLSYYLVRTRVRDRLYHISNIIHIGNSKVSFASARSQCEKILDRTSATMIERPTSLRENKVLLYTYNIQNTSSDAVICVEAGVRRQTNDSRDRAILIIKGSCDTAAHARRCTLSL